MGDATGATHPCVCSYHTLSSSCTAGPLLPRGQQQGEVRSHSVHHRSNNVTNPSSILNEDTAFATSVGPFRQGHDPFHDTTVLMIALPYLGIYPCRPVPDMSVKVHNKLPNLLGDGVIPRVRHGSMSVRSQQCIVLIAIPSCDIYIQGVP